MDQTVRRSHGGLFNATNPVSALLFRAQTAFYITHRIRSIETRGKKALLFLLHSGPPLLFTHPQKQSVGFPLSPGGGVACRSSVPTFWDKATQGLGQPNDSDLLIRERRLLHIPLSDLLPEPDAQVYPVVWTPALTCWRRLSPRCHLTQEIPLI